MDRGTVPTAIFKLGHDELEELLPAAAFAEEDNQPGAALNTIAVALLGARAEDKRDWSEETRVFHTLLRAFAQAGIASPLKLLANIRRWALQGLQDHDLLSSSCLSHLEPPPVPQCPTSPEFAASNKNVRTLTAKQARSILANSFWGNCHDVMAPYKDNRHQGGLDFCYFFRANSHIGLEKLKCILLYFDACGTLEGTSDDKREIIFERIRFLPLMLEGSLGNKSQTQKYVGEGVVLHDSTMEKPTRKASAFVNFANPNFGYGKFIPSCTQEEILQMCCPEFNIGMLFIGKMGDDEVVNVCGVRRFCTYSGYLNSFYCIGPLDSDSPCVETILTMDASYCNHFTQESLERDVSKAYYAYREHAKEMQSQQQQPAVVSMGKWGCGAFGGTPTHKMMQQALAAALAGVDLEFSAFGGNEGCDKVLHSLHTKKPNPAQVIMELREHHKKKEVPTNQLSTTYHLFLLSAIAAGVVYAWWFGLKE